MRLEDFVRPWLMALLALAAPFAYSYPDVNHIIQCSVEANQADWEAQPEYDYRERNQTSQGTKTYDVTMILGSPYRRLVEIDGKGLSPHDRQQELEKLNNTVAEREAESPEERARRIAKYKTDRERDQLFIQQLTIAFDFKLLGKQRMDGHDVYVLRATPRPDYMPPNVDSEVLKGMRGRLWIDTKTFQWVKVEAEVISRCNDRRLSRASRTRNPFRAGEGACFRRNMVSKALQDALEQQALLSVYSQDASGSDLLQIPKTDLRQEIARAPTLSRNSANGFFASPRSQWKRPVQTLV